MPDPSPPRVVVIDGSPVFAEVYRALFAIERFRVTSLSDCGVDPQKVLRLAPDLIVLDLLCGGGMRGLTFLRQLRAVPAGRDVPVLLSTPGSLLDMRMHGAELRALGATVIDGFAVTGKLPEAARTLLDREREEQTG